MDSLDLLNIKSVASTAQSAASASNANKLSSNVQNAENDEELLNACKEFENYLWEQVIKEMKKTVSLFDDGEEDTNGQLVDYFMDSAVSNVASSMTEQSMGVNSLAYQMYEQMKRTGVVTAEELEAKRQEVKEAEVTEEELSENAAKQGIVTEEN